jgi:putative effector of murein hydrolase LrgA (UPF0299 family)
VTNIAVSLFEDLLVAGVIALALEHPVPAACIALVLLATGIALVVLLAKRIRRTARFLRERWRGPPPRGP